MSTISQQVSGAKTLTPVCVSGFKFREPTNSMLPPPPASCMLMYGHHHCYSIMHRCRIRMHTCTCTYVCLHACTHVNAWMCIYLYTCVHIHVCMHTSYICCTHAFTHAYVCVGMYMHYRTCIRWRHKMNLLIGRSSSI